MPSTQSPSTTSDAAALSGTWAVKYSGAFTGTFTLTWHGSGSTLSGNIRLTTAATTLHLNGTVNGNKITFGTVGSTEITYHGTVSGDRMAGTYQVAGSHGGPWSASRSS
jgi:hypothetical protein